MIYLNIFLIALLVVLVYMTIREMTKRHVHTEEPASDLDPQDIFLSAPPVWPLTGTISSPYVSAANTNTFVDEDEEDEDDGIDPLAAVVAAEIVEEFVTPEPYIPEPDVVLPVIDFDPTPDFTPDPTPDFGGSGDFSGGGAGGEW